MTVAGGAASVSGAMDHYSDSPTSEPSQHRGEMAGMDVGMRVLSYLIAGVLCYGGLGWLGDHFFGTSFLLPIGIVLGAAGGCYTIIRRYGQVAGAAAPSTAQRSTTPGPTPDGRTGRIDHDNTTEVAR